MAIWTYPQVPILQESLIGNTNYYPTKFFDIALGFNGAVNNTRVDLWGGPTGTYVFPTSPIQMRVVSTSANDTLAGTGAQKIHIHYLDTNYNVQEEIISLNGLTPVNTVATNILRINAMHVSQVGSLTVSAGNISLTDTAGTVTYGWINAGQNTARQAIYTIPAGKTGYISHWQYSSGTGTGNHFTQFDIRATAHYGVLWPGVFLTIDSGGCLNGGQEVNYPIPIKIPATADVKVSATSDASSANAQCNSVVMGWYE